MLLAGTLEPVTLAASVDPLSYLSVHLHLHAGGTDVIAAGVARACVAAAAVAVAVAAGMHADQSQGDLEANWWAD